MSTKPKKNDTYLNNLFCAMLTVLVIPLAILLARDKQDDKSFEIPGSEVITISDGSKSCQLPIV